MKAEDIEIGHDLPERKYNYENDSSVENNNLEFKKKKKKKVSNKQLTKK